MTDLDIIREIERQIEIPLRPMPLAELTKDVDEPIRGYLVNEQRTHVVSEIQAAWAQVASLAELLTITIDSPTVTTALNRLQNRKNRQLRSVHPRIHAQKWRDAGHHR